METIREDLELIVRENTKVKEYRTQIGLDSNGKAIHITDLINGCLKFFYIRSTLFNARLIIRNAEIREWVLLEDEQLNGSKLYPLKIVNVDKSNTELTINGLEYSELVLNDRLEIEISGGQPNNQLELIIRYV